jgi:hypothetical protein
MVGSLANLNVCVDPQPDLAHVVSHLIVATMASVERSCSARAPSLAAVAATRSYRSILAEPVRMDPGCSYRLLGEKDGFLCYYCVINDWLTTAEGDSATAARRVRVRV